MWHFASSMFSLAPVNISFVCVFGRGFSLQCCFDFVTYLLYLLRKYNSESEIQNDMECDATIRTNKQQCAATCTAFLSTSRTVCFPASENALMQPYAQISNNVKQHARPFCQFCVLCSLLPQNTYEALENNVQGLPATRFKPQQHCSSNETLQLRAGSASITAQLEAAMFHQLQRKPNDARCILHEN